MGCSSSVPYDEESEGFSGDAMTAEMAKGGKGKAKAKGASGKRKANTPADVIKFNKLIDSLPADARPGEGFEIAVRKSYTISDPQGTSNSSISVLLNKVSLYVTNVEEIPNVKGLEHFNINSQNGVNIRTTESQTLAWAQGATDYAVTEFPES